LANPAVLRAATRVPSNLAAQPGGVKLTFSAWREGSNDRRAHTFVLAEVTAAADVAQLAPFKRRGAIVTGYQLTPADVLEVRRLQNENREGAHKSGGRPQSEIGISADACHTGEMRKGPILTSTYLLVSPADGYMTVLEDIDLRKELGDKALAEKVPVCGAG
jgi:hypothetical protein